MQLKRWIKRAAKRALKQQTKSDPIALQIPYMNYEDFNRITYQQTKMTVDEAVAIYGHAAVLVEHDGQTVTQNHVLIHNCDQPNYSHTSDNTTTCDAPSDVGGGE